MDKLVRVRALDGRSCWLLIHLEVQSFQEEQFSLRVYHYHHAIQIAHQADVISLVVLADLNPAWHPREYRYERLGCEIRFSYLTCQAGRQEGRHEGKLSLTILLVERQVGPLDGSARERISNLSDGQLEELAQASFELRGLEDLLRWLAARS